MFLSLLFWPSWKKREKPVPSVPAPRSAKPLAVKTPQPVYLWPCSFCGEKYTWHNYSNSQLKKGDSSRKCKLCIEWCNEIGPVLYARFKGVCMYCNKQFASGDCLTKEHIVPKSKGGSYQIKGACHECNMTRGDDMDFPPFVTLVKRCPAILFMADRRVSVWECNAGGSTLASASQKDVCGRLFNAAARKQRADA